MIKRKTCLIAIAITFSALNSMAQWFTIEENQDGLCNYDGIIENSQSGYTGEGYINIDGGEGASINYSIETNTDSIFNVSWRYALGGGNQNPRDGLLIIDDTLIVDTVHFPYTGAWNAWTYSDTISINLNAGIHKIRLAAIPSSGLANLDHAIMQGSGVQTASCKPSYTFAIDKNDSNGGEVWYEPDLMLYEDGTEITVYALANEGYFFHSWRGAASSTLSEYTFEIAQNTIAKAMFYPEGTTPIDTCIGYASIQHDNGTPFLINGGALGETVTATTIDELKNYLSADEPYTVQINRLFEGNDILNIKSNKTLIGISEDAYLKGIRLDINGAENVIVQNLSISHVLQKDIIEINGGSKNIWLNHLDLFNDREHGTEHYDGILDIKNESSFITVSWCKIHDHYKTILIASGDHAFADSVARITFHHNYFYNCGSRLPSIRFGKAHVFNNYYKNNGTAINSRMNACVRVEKNYFSSTGTAVMMDYSVEKGAVELIDNHFGSSSYSKEPACTLNIPYNYEQVLIDANEVPLIVAGENPTAMHGVQNVTFNLYPNPAKQMVVFELSQNLLDEYNIQIYNTLGNMVKQIISNEKQVQIDVSSLPSGIYECTITAGLIKQNQRLVIIR